MCQPSLASMMSKLAIHSSSALYVFPWVLLEHHHEHGNQAGAWPQKMLIIMGHTVAE